MGGRPLLSSFGLDVHEDDNNHYTWIFTAEDQNFLTDNLPKITAEQRHIFDQFCDKADALDQGITFLDAPGPRRDS